MLEESLIKKKADVKSKYAELTIGSTLLNNKYMLTHLIGKGSFGEVYRGLFLESKEEHNAKQPKYTAIKIENDITKISQIGNQINILQSLNKSKLKEGFPTLYASGIQNGKAFMIMELLGPNLQDLLMLCNGTFTIKTSIMLTMQILDKIEILHQMGYVYRDIKPQNFLMGLGKNSKIVHMVDFGLNKRYRDAKTKLFVPYKEAVSMVGTIRYSSLNSHLGIDQTRRDDLQSMLYMLIYFIKGELPWQSIGFQNKFQKDHMIMNCKLKMTSQELCNGLPAQIENLLQYIKNLDFYQDPDYHYIQTELSFMLESLGLNRDLTYDWENLTDNKISKTYIDIVIPTDEKLETQFSDGGESILERKKEVKVQKIFSHFKN